MNPEQQSFLDYIASCPWNDEAPRLIYADWLEEHDMIEEADRQRKYVSAERGLREFADKCGETIENYDNDGNEIYHKITYDMIVQAGYDYINNDEYFIQMGSQDAGNLMSDDDVRREFWKNWEIVTGVKITEEQRESEIFSCSC